MNKTIYFIYYLFAYPFKKAYRWIGKPTNKPSVLLKWSLTLTVLSIFKDAIYAIWDTRNFSSVLFYTLCTITIIIYILKNINPKYGEHWKQDYNKLKKEGADEII